MNISPELNSKYLYLKNYFLEHGKAAIAFSGGVDSCLLLKVASDALGENVLALIASLNSFQKEELSGAERFCVDNSINYCIIEFDELLLDSFVKNPPERCYYCKKFFMSGLVDFAHSKGYPIICDGTNADDIGDYRPGKKALTELGIASPLKIYGFTKNDIRQLAKELGIEQWNKPSLACLATRIPYGEEITKQKLEMIEKSESFLTSLGFSQLRVRAHNNIGRIELMPDEIARFADESLRENVSEKLIEFGFDYVALDLIGYKNGSMNKGINNG